jgi:N-methylhydantoinase B/oxoprolinase/acetone carboxylase alpha subunit
LQALADARIRRSFLRATLYAGLAIAMLSTVQYFTSDGAIYWVFRVRAGSGGAGAHRGGDRGERRVRFLEPMTAVMLANHRRVAPFGVAGGGPGAPGRNWIERADGRREEHGATFEVQMAAGDVFVVQTPGGGGYGAPEG